jgi:hypothetical protein
MSEPVILRAVTGLSYLAILDSLRYWRLIIKI